MIMEDMIKQRGDQSLNVGNDPSNYFKNSSKIFFDIEFYPLTVDAQNFVEMNLEDIWAEIYSSKFRQNLE